MPSTLDYATRYAELGYLVFPCRPRGKEPLTTTGLHAATTNPLTIREWWHGWPNANIGISCGPDLIVLDIDGVDGLNALRAHDLSVPSTVTAKTAKGHHYYYRLTGTDRNTCRQRIRFLPGLDIKANGSYLIAPPSVHPDGGTYEWEVTPKVEHLSEAPEWLVKFGQDHNVVSGTFDVKKDMVLEAGVSQGSRNRTLFEYACSLRGRNSSKEELWTLLSSANDHCRPPLSEYELKKIASQAWTYEPNEAIKQHQQTTEKQGAIWELSELLEEEYDDVEWIADDLVPPGLTLVAGGPKTGKSFLAGEIALSLSRGDRALAAFPTHRGGCLYLDLEQNERRAQRRWKDVLSLQRAGGEEVKVPPGLHMVFTWPHMPSGLDNIRRYLDERENCKLVVIDVLAAFAGREDDKRNVYRGDYELVSQLVDLCKEYIERGLGVMLLHHTNKLEDRDRPLAAISGSHGLAGAADAVWVLFRKPGEKKADLFVTGKELEERWIDIRMAGLTWVVANPMEHINTKIFEV